MYRQLIRHIYKYDWLLMGAILLLISAGLTTLFSLAGASSFYLFQKQLMWVAVGFSSLFLLSLVDFRIFRTQSIVVFLIYVVAVFLLATVLFVGYTSHGVEAWLKIGNFYVQPVEFTKICLIILLAKFFSKRHVEIYRSRHILVSGVYVGVPLILILLQPDLGSAIVFIAIWLSIIFFSGMRVKHIFFLCAIGVVAATIAWFFVLAPYQKARITSFLNPESDPKGAGYQAIQSIVAVGSGRMWGKGIGYGSQSHLNFLPEAETDFIFAAYAEEWGFVGSVVMILLFFIVVRRIIAIGMSAADNFSRLYTLGFGAFIFVQSFIHIGINMGVLPITGITLPFVSYGGSSLVTLLAGVGIVQNIKMNARRALNANRWREIGE